MKKNEVKNENINVVENNTVENIGIEPIMDEETMQAIVDDNIDIVPKNQRKKFEAMTLKQKVAKIQFYHDMQKMREDARIKNSVLNRVKEVFTKRHATIEDAKQVLDFAQEFVDNFRQHQIEEIDKKIAELEEMKIHL